MYRAYRTTNQYDVVGRRVAVTDARGFRATSVFDALGQVTASIDPLGRIATQTFDAAQRPVSSQDGNGHVTTLLYDLDSRRVATLDALGYLTTNVYDPASQEIAMLDPRGNRWSTTYDAASRPIAKIDPLNRRETSGYDAANRRTLRVDARGFATTYSHDAVGQTLGWIYPNAQRATLSYDPNGNRTAMADWTGEYSYEYTALNQLAAESNALGKRLSYGYDSVQSLSLLMNADGGSTTYQYDALNRVTVTQDAAGGRTTTSYDATNNRTLKILPNGTRSSSVFDGASQLVDLSHLKSDDSVIGRYQYGYDNASNVTLTTEANGDTIAWSYDALNRLTGDVRTGSDAYNKQLTYDPVGNRLVENASGTLTTSTFDVANQLSNSISGGGTTLYTFDLSGNQQIVQTPGGALTTNIWDYENQNTKVLLPSGDSVDMQFSAANRRVAKVSAVTDKVFLWSSVTDNIIQDLSPVGLGEVANSFLPGTYGELIKQDDGQSSFFLFDRRGSTMTIANSTQVITDTFRFDGYGNLVARTGSSLTPFQFQGAWGYFADAELGSVYIRRRSYAPATGRWASVDIFGFIDGINFYMPTFIPSLADPTGFWVHIEGSIWQAEDDDRFPPKIRELAPTLDSTMNMSCIRPIRSQDNEINHQMLIQWKRKRPAACGQYDFGNLTDAWPNGGTITASVGRRDSEVDNGYIGAVADIYRVQNKYDTGMELAEKLKEASGSGKTPIKQLIIIGHSWGGLHYIGSAIDGDTIGQFALSLINPIEGWPKFEDALDGVFPSVCWFRTDAEVRLVGCKTAGFAGTFARKILRHGAKAFGTKIPTWTDGNRLGWGQDPNANDRDGRFDPVATPDEFHRSDNWEAFDGTN